MSKGNNTTIEGVKCVVRETCIVNKAALYLCPHRHIFISVDGCSYGEMRLVGGRNEAEGRVEICHYDMWGTICGNEWSDRHTAVVCRYLGFSDDIGGI